MIRQLIPGPRMNQGSSLADPSSDELRLGDDLVRSLRWAYRQVNHLEAGLSELGRNGVRVQAMEVQRGVRAVRVDDMAHVVADLKAEEHKSTRNEHSVQFGHGGRAMLGRDVNEG